MAIDERALEWQRLLPPSSRFSFNSGPAELRELMAARLSANPNAYLGWRVTRAELPLASPYESLVLINPRGVDVMQLEAAGFSHTLQFSVLPSLANPRVFAPLDNARVAARALDFITLYRPLARLARRLTFQLARLGQLHLLGDRILVARRRESDLECWLRSATGLGRVFLAISPGGISHKRKVTLQVMAADGRVAGFAKVATTPKAVEATERESAWLDQLAHYAQLEGSVPRLIQRATVGDAFVTLLSAGPRELAPRTFQRAHWAFLSMLQAATETRRPFLQSTMWTGMQAGFEALRPNLTSAWQSRLSAAFGRLRRLVDRTIPVSLAHRDFQPGNMRQFADGRLFVYDWEGAQPESTPLYDFFNFDFLHSARLKSRQIDVGTYLTKAVAQWHPHAEEDLLPAFFAAYLVDHSLRRMTNSDLGRDERSVVALDVIAELLDCQGEWLVLPNPY